MSAAVAADDLMSLVDDEEGEENKRRKLRLPFIIGSREFNDHQYIGLVDLGKEVADLEEEEAKERENNIDGGKPEGFVDPFLEEELDAPFEPPREEGGFAGFSEETMDDGRGPAAPVRAPPPTQRAPPPAARGPPPPGRAGPTSSRPPPPVRGRPPPESPATSGGLFDDPNQSYEPSFFKHMNRDNSIAEDENSIFAGKPASQWNAKKKVCPKRVMKFAALHGRR